MASVPGFPDDVIAAYRVMRAVDAGEGFVEVSGYQAYPQPYPEIPMEVFEVENMDALEWTFYGKTADGRVVGSKIPVDDATQE